MASGPTPNTNIVSDLLVLSSTGQVWATVNTGTPQDPRNGLYVGQATDGALVLQTLRLNGPLWIRSTADEAYVLVADDSVVYRVDPHHPSSATAMFSANQIYDIAIRGHEVYVAYANSTSPLHSTLAALSIDLTATSSVVTLAGTVERIIALPTSSVAIALVTYSGSTILDLFAPGLARIGSASLTYAPGAYALINGSNVVGFSSTGSPGHYFEFDAGTKQMIFDLPIPDSAQIDALVHDEMTNLVVASGGGLISVIDRANRRPLLSSQIHLPERTNATRLQKNNSTGVVYALDAAGGLLYPLVR
jgi:hypothetical protein